MGIFDEAADEVADRMTTSSGDRPTETAGTTATLSVRSSETTVAGETVTVEEPETTQTEDDSWLSARNKYGWPRGRDALEAREIVQTSAMQSIANGITDQLLGGELSFESDDDDVDSAEAEVRTLLKDVLTGPHLMHDDLDDLITAAVEDMLGPGNAYWQLLGAKEGSIPVVSLVPLDALTIRHNFNRHGYPQDPPYYQAPGAFTGDGVAAMSSIDPTPLQQDDLAVMHYPKGRRSHRVYPMSPSQQVKEWLEILANSTTHHNRFYSDNEIPPGLLQVMQGTTQQVQNVKDKIQAASGDPRDVPVIGGDGGAQWLDLGGTAVNLNIIEEQKWFFQLCLGALGLGKHELGFTEDANRSNGEVEAARIYKRIAGPFAKQFEKSFSHIARQFDVYQALDEPFEVRIRHNDPREERAREERLREMYQADGLTLRQYVRRRGDEDLADNEMQVELNGQVVDYGDHPKFVAEHLLREARSDADGEDDDMGGDDDVEGL